jgi:hypothetical protein
MTSQNPQEDSTPDLSPELIKDFIEIQKQKAINEARQLQLQEKEIELSANYAEKALDHHARYLLAQPVESRKTITRIGWVTSLIIIIFLGFITTWICMGKDQFAYKFLQGISYVVTTAIGYWAGSRRRKEKDTTDKIDDAEIVD